ncbi:MAG: DUF1573 domain-containing protein [bacterium]|uniref:DUF1573 domain-containing protein n=1 Tax=Candidatus Aphodosoma intestinipullorum TaxID=2840674 RepID=A0A940DJJ5_9BACT|nr:DUF1573 domain-containing protein [Candidatus Aphodosoma intestinipullorum]
MKKLILFAFAVFMVTGLAAQQKEVVKFNEKTHDFGTVKEEDGRITCTFSFDNLLATPISIKNVRASCGCTTPNWSREPIAPNAKGEITVTYNTKGRPGMFQKSVTVTFSDGTQDYTQVLFIKGKVTPRVVATPAPATQPATK